MMTERRSLPFIPFDGDLVETPFKNFPRSCLEQIPDIKERWAEIVKTQRKQLELDAEMGGREAIANIFHGFHMTLANERLRLRQLQPLPSEDLAKKLAEFQADLAVMEKEGN